MASIYLVRHGQAQFGTDDYDRLSERGFRQARLAGEYLRRTTGGVDHVVSGTLRRQVQTATEIANCLGAGDVRLDERLNEIDVDVLLEHIVPRLDDSDGELAKLASLARSSSRSYQKLLKRVFLHWQALADLPADMESWPEFSARTGAMLRDSLRGRGPAGRTVLVTSGAVIAAVVQQVLALPAESAYPLFEVLLNCSITHLLFDRERVSVSSFNDCSYLVMGGSRAEEPELLTYR